MTIPVIRGTTRADLLSLPSIMLGFPPEDSCVVMALRGTSVKFCARIDLEWFAEQFERVSAQVLRCAREAEADEFVFIGYGDPDVAGDAVARFTDHVGERNVLEALVTDGRRAWSIFEAGGPEPYRFETSAVAAQAVYSGVNLAVDRATAVAPITTSEPAGREALAEAEREVAVMSDEVGMERLRELAEGCGPLTAPQALLLAVLLGDDDRMTALLCRLTMANADAMWERLVAARRVGPEPYENNVLGLLGFASWLSGRGAAHSACLQELTRRCSSHPLLLTLARLHRDGVPPTKW